MPRGTFTVCKDFQFAAAHFIEGHRGGCENLHGHNYRVRVCVRSRSLDDLGMVVDFADLKQAMTDVLGRFDHRVINEVPPFDRRSATAESLAQYVAAELADRLAGEQRSISRVEVWENDSSQAVFEPDAE